MNPEIERQLARSFDLYDDLVASISEPELASKLPVPSNTVWDQLWCVVGARESTVRAIAAGEWVGFDCSLTAAQRGRKEPLQDALAASRVELEEALRTADGDKYGVGTLVHEAMHQGQIIRYLYGVPIDIPKSWAKRWSL